MPDAVQRQRGGHKPNYAMRKKRAVYRAQRRLNMNKCRRIERALAETHSADYAAHLTQRLAFWRTWVPATG